MRCSSSLSFVASTFGGCPDIFASCFSYSFTSEPVGDNVKLSLKHDAKMSGQPPKVDATKLSEELQRIVRQAN